MPGPLALAGIAAGASLLGTGVQAFAQGKMNRKTRQWNEKMYNLQRQHALADWNMQNEYNSPAAQMARYKAGGLNPNLIYGQPNEGGVVRSSDAKSWNPQAPDYESGAKGVGNSLLMYYQMKNIEADLANKGASNTNIAQDTAVKAAQEKAILAGIPKTGVETDTLQFNLDFEKEVRDAKLEIVRDGVRKLKADINFTLHQDERAALLNTTSVAEALERMITMRLQRTKTPEEIKEIQARIKALNLDSDLKEQDLKLRKQGIYPGDPVWLRAVLQSFNTTIQKLLGVTPPKVDLEEGQRIRESHKGMGEGPNKPRFIPDPRKR